MNEHLKIPLITTIKERCRVCYHCIRECPAKAIRIADGQAEVIAERCLGCGNCVRICSQKAKEVFETRGALEHLLREKEVRGTRIAACLAPSFPAEFEDLDYKYLVGILKSLGFDYVHEVAFGADLVSREYRRLLERSSGSYIATTCPAIVAYIEKYHPEIIDNLAPIVSPMIATARVIHQLYGPEVKIAFFGPCIAKKNEAWLEALPNEVDVVLTFSELRSLLKERGLLPWKTDSRREPGKEKGGREAGDKGEDSGKVSEGLQEITPGEFDFPHGSYGALYSVSRGILQSAGIQEDLITGEVVAADGRTAFVESIKEFEAGNLKARLLEVLCCHGCISGAGMTTDMSLFSRRHRVSQYVRMRKARLDQGKWREYLERFSDLDLSRRYLEQDVRFGEPPQGDLIEVLRRMGKIKPDDELNCGACGYDTCREHAVAVLRGLAETEMCLPYAIDKLRVTVKELAASHTRLADAQEALMHSEKLASMGQLAAGVAHEVNNPLGVVLMYAHLLLDELEEDSKLRPDVSMIAAEADRCKKIVAGLLHFARQNKAVLLPCDINGILERATLVAPPPEKVDLEIHQQVEDPVADLDADQIIQVLTNLLVNAYSAVRGSGRVTVITEGDERMVKFTVKDNGIGIPPAHMSKLFTPFFTTKQIGKGTGLGLAISYGIIKIHNGDIKVTSNADPAAGPTGTVFTVTLPRGGEGMRQEPKNGMKIGG